MKSGGHFWGFWLPWSATSPHVPFSQRLLEELKFWLQCWKYFHLQTLHLQSLIRLSPLRLSSFICHLLKPTGKADVPAFMQMILTTLSPRRPFQLSLSLAEGQLNIKAVVGGCGSPGNVCWLKGSWVPLIPGKWVPVGSQGSFQEYGFPTTPLTSRHIPAYSE